MISCLVAVERNQGIGFNNFMPWPHLKGDLSWFKRLTLNQVVIMGSSTWKSLGRPLPNRINVVLSKLNQYETADHNFDNIESAIKYCQSIYPDKEIFIMGGQSIYDQCMPIIDKFYITEIDEDYICDKFFNLTYVKEHCPTVIIHETHVDPVTYIIKEYTK